jgi:hemoglobin-like flavoprotein
MPALDRERIADFCSSLDRCHASPGFIDRFYQRFIATSPEVAEAFEHTDLERQRRALSSSLYALVLAIEGGDAAVEYLDRIARKHARNELDIRPELYDVWLDCLVDTVRECDPEFSQQVERLWRDALAFGVEFMKARY